MTTPAITFRSNDDQWIELSARIPAVTVLMGRYLDQAAVTLRPTSVIAADRALRGLASFLIGHRPDVTSAAGIDRETIEDYKLDLARSMSAVGKPLRPTPSVSGSA